MLIASGGTTIDYDPQKFKLAEMDVPATGGAAVGIGGASIFSSSSSAASAAALAASKPFFA